MNAINEVIVAALQANGYDIVFQDDDGMGKTIVVDVSGEEVEVSITPLEND